MKLYEHVFVVKPTHTARSFACEAKRFGGGDDDDRAATERTAPSADAKGVSSSENIGNTV